MSEITELAGRLGKAIAESLQAANLRAARKAMAAETGLTKLLNDYQVQADKVSRLEEENKPVEVSDKHALEELHDKLISSETFKKYTAAQMEYIDVMRQVNQTLRQQLAETEKD